MFRNSTVFRNGPEDIGMAEETRGANSIGILIQLDSGRAPDRTFNPPQQQHRRGWQWFFGS